MIHPDVEQVLKIIPSYVIFMLEIFLSKKLRIYIINKVILFRHSAFIPIGLYI